MADGKRIDIVQEFVDLYNREDMLGFFDFTIEGISAEPVSGLCRISKPKTAQMPYVSLTFVIDTQDPHARDVIEDLLAKMDGEGLKAELPEAVEVIPAPVPDTSGGSYVRQVDVLLED